MTTPTIIEAPVCEPALEALEAAHAARDAIEALAETVPTLDEVRRLRTRVADIDQRMGQGASQAVLTGEVVKLKTDMEICQRQVDDLDHLVAAVDSLEQEISALAHRPLFRLPAESTGWLVKLQSRKFLVTVAGVPIAWLASKLGVDTAIVIAGIGALATFVLGQSAVDSAAAKAAGPHAPLQ